MAQDKIVNLSTMFDKTVPNNDTVFIVPHNRPDFDAIGAAIAIYIICTILYNKNAYIIINDDEDEIKTGARKVINEIRNNIKIVKAHEMSELLTEKSLLIVTDTNSEDRISIKNHLESFNDILILDHHNQNKSTIKADENKKFIYDCYSSTCEMIAHLLHYIKFDIGSIYANYLLAGIVLDTNNFIYNKTLATFRTALRLKRINGADEDTVRNLFTRDPEQLKKINELISKRIILDSGKTKISIACDLDNDNKIYTPIDIAIASDDLFAKDRNIDATFALGYTDYKKTISISTRGKDTVNVSEIVEYFNGDGRTYAAGAEITPDLLEKIISNLEDGEALSKLSPLEATKELLIRALNAKYINYIPSENIKSDSTKKVEGSFMKRL